jgi:type II secretory pathway component PulM
MRPLSPRERRLVAIGLLVLAFAMVWLRLVQPLASGFAERAERREQLCARYAQNERLVGRIAALRRTAEAQQRQSSAFSVAAPNAEQAGERLKERLEASLAKAGGELRSSESVETAPGWVRASVTAVVSNDQLLDWLGQLTNEPPYLAMESLTIGADRAINSNQMDLLDVKLEASIPLGPTKPR